MVEDGGMKTFIALLLAASSGVTPASPLSTEAERSGFQRTGRYAEVERLCPAFAKAYPRQVRCVTFGRTPQGRPMLALVANAQGRLTPQAAQKASLPVVLVQGAIHAGEVDGKDAGFWALRELLDAKALDRQVLVFVPVFNVDGHERFGAWNRPNQRGPAEMGWRTTAQNHNLNRDYAKVDTPEMAAMLALVNRWDPLLMVDLHTTDGAQFQHDIAIMVEPLASGDEALRAAGRQWRDGVIAELAAKGSLPLPFYPSFVDGDNPASGIADSVPPPRFSQGYFVLRNRMGMLVETHSWRDYPTRVRITRNTVHAVVKGVAEHGAQWLQTARAADLRASALAGQPVPLRYQATPTVRTIDFQGYAYTRTQSEVSGALMTRYDERKPEVWRIPLRDELTPALSATAPGAGYLVPAEHALMVGGTLQAHDIVYRRLDRALADLPVQAFRAETSKLAAATSEGRQRVELQGQWAPERHSVAAGGLFVPIAQAKARLVMALLEPQAPDALAAWGHFNLAWERREYMEPYVAEAVAREQLQDPAVRAAFDARLAADADFAKSAQARLEFFYRRHPSWDQRFGLYPVFKLGSAP